MVGEQLAECSESLEFGGAVEAIVAACAGWDNEADAFEIAQHARGATGEGAGFVDGQRLGGHHAVNITTLVSRLQGSEVRCRRLFVREVRSPPGGVCRRGAAPLP